MSASIPPTERTAAGAPGARAWLPSFKLKLPDVARFAPGVAIAAFAVGPEMRMVETLGGVLAPTLARYG